MYIYIYMCIYIYMYIYICIYIYTSKFTCPIVQVEVLMRCEYL